MRYIKDLIDEKRDYVADNKRFDELLASYYAGKADSMNELWEIMIRAAANQLKKKYGHYWTSQMIEDTSLDATIHIMQRIQNREKYPDGYSIKNLPSVIKYQIINEVYNNAKKQEDRETVSIEELYGL